MSNIKILIAEDEREVLEIMAKWVRGEGYTVITASDGDEAWQKVQDESPDIILLDLMMPGKHGLEVLQMMRENPSEKWQPVIIISALGQLDDIKKGFSLEADHYITKPCNMDVVLRAIRTMVSLIPQRKTAEEVEG